MNCKKLLWVSFLALTACHYQRASFQPPPAPDAAEVSLARAARAVHNSLHQLSELKRAAAPANKRLVRLSRYAMPGRTTVRWTGPLEPLLLNLVQAHHWKLVTLGKRPAIPVLVSLNAFNQPSVQVLRDLDLQSGSKASLRAIPKSKVIELQYHNV